MKYNLTFFLFCWYLRRESWPDATRRFARAFMPTLLVALLYLALVLYYAIAYGDPPRSQSDLDYNPEIISYFLPFTPTSLYSDWPRSLGLAGLDAIEPAVYLGLGVLPLAIAGLALRRHERLVPHLALVGGVFLVFSLGPKLLWERDVVEIFDEVNAAFQPRVELVIAVWEDLGGDGLLVGEGRVEPTAAGEGNAPSPAPRKPPRRWQREALDPS